MCRPAVVRPRAVGRGLEDVEKVLTDRTAGFVVAFAGVCVNPAARPIPPGGDVDEHCSVTSRSGSGIGVPG